MNAFALRSRVRITVVVITSVASSVDTSSTVVVSSTVVFSSTTLVSAPSFRGVVGGTRGFGASRRSSPPVRAAACCSASRRAASLASASVASFSAASLSASSRSSRSSSFSAAASARATLRLSGTDASVSVTYVSAASDVATTEEYSELTTYDVNADSPAWRLAAAFRATAIASGTIPASTASTARTFTPPA